MNNLEKNFNHPLQQFKKKYATKCPLVHPVIWDLGRYPWESKSILNNHTYQIQVYESNCNNSPGHMHPSPKSTNSCIIGGLEICEKSLAKGISTNLPFHLQVVTFKLWNLSYIWCNALLPNHKLRQLKWFWLFIDKDKKKKPLVLMKSADIPLSPVVW